MPMRHLAVALLPSVKTPSICCNTPLAYSIGQIDGGESAGRVKIFVGPKIKIDGQDYILVFHWEEKPLAEYMQGNGIKVFDDMLLSLKFFN